MGAGQHQPNDIVQRKASFRAPASNIERVQELQIERLILEHPAAAEFGWSVQTTHSWLRMIPHAGLCW